MLLNNKQSKFKKIYKPEDIEKIKKLYLEDLFSIEKIAKQLNVSQPTIRKILKEENIKLRPAQFYSQKLELLSFSDDIIDKYVNENLSIMKIANYYNTSINSIRTIIRQNNVNFKNNTDYARKKINHSYFSKITTPIQAYILGFIAADGCVFNKSVRSDDKRHELKIQIHQKDIEILIKIGEELINNFSQDMLEFGHRVSPNGTRIDWVRLSINSKELINDLYQNNIVPKKSLILQPPILDNELISSFILGLFDGDGSINNDLSRISLVGTFEIVNYCFNYLESRIDNYNNDFYLYQEPKKSSKNTYILKCSRKNTIIKILDVLYNSQSFYLKRKHDLYLQLKSLMVRSELERENIYFKMENNLKLKQNFSSNKTIITYETQVQIFQYVKEFYTVAEIAKKTNISIKELTEFLNHITEKTYHRIQHLNRILGDKNQKDRTNIVRINKLEKNNQNINHNTNNKLTKHYTDRDDLSITEVMEEYLNKEDNE